MGALLLGLLGFGKTLLGWALEVAKALFNLAVKKPFVFLTIVLSLAFAGSLWYANGLKDDLSVAKTTIKAKDDFIGKQDKRLKEYVDALAKEKETLRTTIETNNKAIADLKRTADQALANAQREAQKAEAKRQEYLDLAEQYKNANPSLGTAEERIQREERTTDKFIEDWRNAR